jgi:hypothetical protein
MVIHSTARGASVLGSLSPLELSSEDADVMSDNLTAFEEWARNNSQFAVSDTFAFLLQPLSPSLPCTLLHLSPDSQGKATHRILVLLAELKNLLRRENVQVPYYGFDADSTYSKLVKSYVDFVDNTVSKVRDFRDWNCVRHDNASIIDPLHLLKRFRYRLLNCDVRNGFSSDSPLVNWSAYKGKLNVPKVVFRNRLFTKMNDDLPLHLFTLKNLFIYHDFGDLAMLAYSLVPTLLASTFNDEQMSTLDRRYFLEVVYWYMLLYDKVTSQSKDPLRETKRNGDSNVRLFTNAFLSDARSIAISALAELHSKDLKAIYMNRLGSNPVEHFFGRCRMLSRNQHRWERLTNIVRNDLLVSEIKNEYEIGTRLDGSGKRFGVSVILVDGQLHFSRSARIVATSLLMKFGYAVTLALMPVGQVSSVRDITKSGLDRDIVDDFFLELASISPGDVRKHPWKSLSTIMLESKDISAIKSRLDKKVMTG